MARNDGSNSGTVDFDALVQEQKDKAQRLADMAKRHAAFQKERERLDKDEAAFLKEVQTLGLGNAIGVSRPRKPKVEKTAVRKSAKGKNKGNGGKVKVQRQQKPARKGNGGNGTRGLPLHDILLSVLPGPEEESITKDEIAKRVAGEGHTSKSSNPKIVIGQSLGASNHFKNTGRGLWRLSKLGERARDKMFKGAVADAAANTPSTPAADAAQPSAPAQQSDAAVDNTQPVATA